MPKFTSNISASGLRKLKQDIERYNDSLTYKCQMLVQRLAQIGVEVARVQIADFDAIFTTELLQSIHSEYGGAIKNGAVYFVVADSEHAIFVEIGTGIIGAQHPYPGNLPEYTKYAQGRTIHYTKDGNKYGWFYPGDDGRWYFTEGMPSRPFMYNTTLELLARVPVIAKEIFGSG